VVWKIFLLLNVVAIVKNQYLRVLLECNDRKLSIYMVEIWRNGVEYFYFEEFIFLVPGQG
jgi:hypothetical protein